MENPGLSGNKRDEYTPERPTERRCSARRSKTAEEMDVDGAQKPPGILRSTDPKSPAKKKSKQQRGWSSSKDPKPKSSRSKTPRRRPSSKTPASKGKGDDPNTSSTKDSYANKAKATPKKIQRLKESKFVQGVISRGKSSSFRLDVYRGLTTMLTIAQSAQGGKNCRILSFNEPDEPPLLTAGQMPKLHTDVKKYFHFPGKNSAWNGVTQCLERRHGACGENKDDRIRVLDRG